MADMTALQLEELRTLCDEFCLPRNYKLHQRLGFGGSAAVFKVETPTGDIALKAYLPSFLKGHGAKAEARRIELQRTLIGHSCPTLVQLLDVIFERETCFIEMQFFPWEDLSKLITKIPRERIYPLLRQLIDAVIFLEGRSIVHRDIKPANILIDPTFSQLVLIDLGVVREASSDEDREDNTDHDQLRPFIATNQYSSPEYLFRTLPPSPTLWKALTIYQIGGVLHDLITRRPLFEDEVKTGNRYAVALAVQQKMPNLDSFLDVEADLKLLAFHCLSKDPVRRLNLVDWDRFQKPSSDLADLIKRVSALEGAKERQHTQQQEILRKALDRRDISVKLFECVHSLLKEHFTKALLEISTDGAEPSKCVLRWHFPTHGWAVDISMEVVWPASENALGMQPEVWMQGALNRSNSQVKHAPGTCITTADHMHKNFEPIAQAALLVAGNYVSKALSILEHGEPVAETTILGD